MPESKQVERRLWILVGVLSIFLVGMVVAGVSYVIGYQPSNLSERTFSLETKVDNHIAHIRGRLDTLENKVDTIKEGMKGIQDSITELGENINEQFGNMPKQLPAPPE